MNLTKYELTRELTLCKLENQRLRVELKELRNKNRKDMRMMLVLMAVCFAPVAFVVWRCYHA